MKLLFCLLLSLAVMSCANRIIPEQQPLPVTLEAHGDCVYIEFQSDYLCLVIEDTEAGWVNANLLVKSSNQTIVAAQTYLTAMTVEFSPNKDIFMVAVSSEGHPSFGFYDTRRVFQAHSEIRADYYLDEYYFDHFETIQDNGDVVFALMEHNGQLCEMMDPTDRQQHTGQCLSGFNVFSKQALSLEHNQLCSH